MIKITKRNFSRKVLLKPYYLNYVHSIILVGGTPLWTGGSNIDISHIFLLLFRRCLHSPTWLTMQSWFIFDTVIGG
jgi:hypothetical protein